MVPPRRTDLPDLRSSIFDLRSSTVQQRAEHVAAADDERADDHPARQPAGGAVERLHRAAVDLQAQGEAVVGQLVEDHLGAPRRVLDQVLHVEHPGEDPPGRELRQDPLLHHVEHVVADQLHRVELGREHAHRAVEVEHRLAQ